MNHEYTPLPADPTTTDMVAFCIDVAKAERGDADALMSQRYFPLGRYWPKLKQRQRAEIKAAGSQREYCKTVLGGLNYETARLSEKAAFYESDAEQILAWFSDPNRGQFQEWQPKEKWALKRFLEIAVKWEIRNEPPPTSVPNRKGVAEPPTGDPGFMGPRDPLMANLTPEQASEITTRAARAERAERLVEQRDHDLAAANNLIMNLQQRTVELEHALLENGIEPPAPTMSDELAGWLKNMTDPGTPPEQHGPGPRNGARWASDDDPPPSLITTDGGSPEGATRKPVDEIRAARRGDGWNLKRLAAITPAASHDDFPSFVRLMRQQYPVQGPMPAYAGAQITDHPIWWVRDYVIISREGKPLRVKANGAQ